MLPTKEDIILVTGGHGFIGSHCAARLLQLGLRVRIIDVVSKAPIIWEISPEVVIGNLCDMAVCQRAVQNVHTVMHFAATMGGMGTIHAVNDFVIYAENHSMTTNILSAALSAGVKQFFFASSACVYSEFLQREDSNKDASLAESDTWLSQLAPKPQGLYGLEKLVAELILLQYTSKIDIRIARFHNVYGPGGAWNNGREKAPAALLRKALAAKRIGSTSPRLEVWGSGRQRRSFLWIDDCVDAVLLLLKSNCVDPINIGSDTSISVKELMDLAISSVGLDAHSIEVQYDLNKPIGVASRNSNNEFVKKTLGWAPATTLEDGMKRTAQWMQDRITEVLLPLDDNNRASTLDNYQRSIVVDLKTEVITFAILLPITSRGLSSPGVCLSNLVTFAQSLARTTRCDMHRLGGIRYHVRVYLAIDYDDTFLLNAVGQNRAEAILNQEGLMDVVTLLCNYPRGHICSLWRHCARTAWTNGCDYFLLAGDDVVLQDEGWMRDIHDEFKDLAKTQGVPEGFGCVAFTDTSFPGMPTFPIIHRTHLEIFNGEVVPEIFINQDGDPYLFQLYRRWGCSRMYGSRICNMLGGSGEARYHKEHAQDWTFGTLKDSLTIIDSWIRKYCPDIQQKITLDVVIPCYRVQLAILETILKLEVPKTCATMFIVIIDNPASPHTFELQSKYGHRADVRIRVNDENMGASASRNRGMAESAADWIHFLDDDISPRGDLLYEAEKIIRQEPNAAGFVGNAVFPSADSIFTAAVHLSGVTYFWDIATKMTDDLPWGVTANLISRRDIKDGVEFDCQFPRTGGGEDIDFCLQKREVSIQKGGGGFHAAPNVVVTHPWWSGGARSYWRFYMWSVGDGGLVKKYPEHSYRDHSPNSAEMLLIWLVILVVGIGFGLVKSRWYLFLFAMKNITSIALSNVIHDSYRHLWRDADRTSGINTTINGPSWIIAVMESSFLRMASESGRAIGMLTRREFLLLGKRFDWFTGRAGTGPKDEEIRNGLQRLSIYVALVAWGCIM